MVDGDFDDGFDAAALLAAAERLAPASAPPRFGVVYGSGLEVATRSCWRSWPAGRQLFGNAPATVRRARRIRGSSSRSSTGSACRIRRFAYVAAGRSRGLADEAGRRLRRRPCRAGARRRGANGGCYFQRVWRGSGRRVVPRRRAPRVLLGFSEQWSSPDDQLSLRRPAAAGRDQRARRRCDSGALDGLIARTRTGRDSTVSISSSTATNFHILEVNPRPGANLDVFDGADPAGLFGLHIAACEGPPARALDAPPQATAMSVLYAERPLRVPRPDTLAGLGRRPAGAGGADRDGRADLHGAGSRACARRRARRPSPRGRLMVFSRLLDGDDSGNVRGRGRHCRTMPPEAARPSLYRLTQPLLRRLIDDAAALCLGVETTAEGCIAGRCRHRLRRRDRGRPAHRRDLPGRARQRAAHGQRPVPPLAVDAQRAWRRIPCWPASAASWPAGS